MQKDLTTRRAVIAGVVTTPALVSFTTSAHEADEAKLLELGKEFKSITQRLENCDWSDDLLLAALDAVESEILQIRATTMEGLFVKASAACWALLGDLNIPSRGATDTRMSISIIRDLVRHFEPRLEKPGALRKLLDEIEYGPQEQLL